MLAHPRTGARSSVSSSVAGEDNRKERFLGRFLPVQKAANKEQRTVESTDHAGASRSPHHSGHSDCFQRKTVWQNKLPPITGRHIFDPATAKIGIPGIAGITVAQHPKRRYGSIRHLPPTVKNAPGIVCIAAAKVLERKNCGSVHHESVVEDMPGVASVSAAKVAERRGRSTLHHTTAIKNGRTSHDISSITPSAVLFVRTSRTIRTMLRPHIGMAIRVPVGIRARPMPLCVAGNLFRKTGRRMFRPAKKKHRKRMRRCRKHGTASQQGNDQQENGESFHIRRVSESVYRITIRTTKTVCQNVKKHPHGNSARVPHRSDGRGLLPGLLFLGLGSLLGFGGLHGALQSSQTGDVAKGRLLDRSVDLLHG